MVSGIYSDILFGILSDIYFGILSDIYAGVLSDIFSGFLSDILSVFFSGILSGILSVILSDICSGILSGLFSGILSDIYSGSPSDIYSDMVAVFVGIDPEDIWKRQTFPISKALLLKQFDFLQKNSKPHQTAACRKSDVAEWVDGETPDVFRSKFIDAPVEDLEEEVEELIVGSDSNKYRGPVDSTLCAQELQECSDAVPVSLSGHSSTGQEHVLAGCCSQAGRNGKNG